MKVQTPVDLSVCILFFNDDNTITYDEIGNPLTYYNNLSFEWQGRLLISAHKETDEYEFAYNDGHRVSKTVNGKKTEYVYDGSRLIAEKSENTTVLYVYDETGSPIGFQVAVFSLNSTDDVVISVDTYWYTKNLQGDIINVRNECGDIIAKYNYNPYGKILNIEYLDGLENTTVTYNSLFYRSYFYDVDLELYYLGTRYYDAVIGKEINNHGGNSFIVQYTV